MTRRIGVIGAPSSMGAFAPGQEQAPRALRDAGLLMKLAQAGLTVEEFGDLPLRRWRPDPANWFAQNAAAVVENAAAVADRVREVAATGACVLVLGGDCTTGVGTVAGMLHSHERIGLLYFDIHADLNTPRSVTDGALDWTGVAHLLGEADATPGLSRIGPRFPLLDPDRLLLFAHDPGHATDWELGRIAHHGIATIPVTEVAADPERTAARALDHLLARCDRVLIHFDVDTIDFTDAPLSENTGRNYGLPLATTFRALTTLLASDRIAGLTITELNPDHGAEDGTTVADFVDRLVAAFAGGE